MKKKGLISIIILLIIIGIGSFYYYNHSKSKDNISANPTSSLVQVDYVRAKDGDTLVVKENGQEKTIRLIGIDTPESVHPNTTKNTKEGISASEHTKELLKDTTTLYLEYDKEKQDKYGRDLAYVWLNQDTSNTSNMLNKKLIDEGYAVPLAIKPNTKYKNIFEGK